MSLTEEADTLSNQLANDAGGAIDDPFNLTSNSLKVGPNTMGGGGGNRFQRNPMNTLQRKQFATINHFEQPEDIMA